MKNSNKTIVAWVPRRKGVVIRADGISDTYGTPYARDPRTRSLRRIGPKVRALVRPLAAQ